MEGEQHDSTGGFDAFRLPHETWIQILLEVADYEGLKRASRISKQFRNFIEVSTITHISPIGRECPTRSTADAQLQGSEFDSILFRSPPPTVALAKGEKIKLHPMIHDTDGFFTELERAWINNSDYTKFYSPRDYPSILNEEFATSPASTEIVLKFQPSTTRHTYSRPLHNPSGVTVRDFLNLVADYWMTTAPYDLPEARDVYGIPMDEDVKHIHCVYRAEWTGWLRCSAKGDNRTEAEGDWFAW